MTYLILLLYASDVRKILIAISNRFIYDIWLTPNCQSMIILSYIIHNQIDGQKNIDYNGCGTWGVLHLRGNICPLDTH